MTENKVSCEVLTENEVKRMVLLECDEYMFNPISKNISYKQLLKKIVENSEIVILRDSQLIGVAAMYVNNYISKEAFITIFVIKEAFQGKYMGTELMKKCITLAKERGMKKIRLEVNKKNERAYHFYLKMGFSLSVDATEDGVYMEMNIK